MATVTSGVADVDVAEFVCEDAGATAGGEALLDDDALRPVGRGVAEGAAGDVLFLGRVPGAGDSLLEVIDEPGRWFLGEGLPVVRESDVHGGGGTRAGAEAAGMPRMMRRGRCALSRLDGQWPSRTCTQNARC